MKEDIGEDRVAVFETQEVTRAWTRIQRQVSAFIKGGNSKFWKRKKYVESCWGCSLKEPWLQSWVMSSDGAIDQSNLTLLRLWTELASKHGSYFVPPLGGLAPIRCLWCTRRPLSCRTDEPASLACHHCCFERPECEDCFDLHQSGTWRMTSDLPWQQGELVKHQSLSHLTTIDIYWVQGKISLVISLSRFSKALSHLFCHNVFLITSVVSL